MGGQADAENDAEIYLRPDLYLADEGLRKCSLEAQAVWNRLAPLMLRGEPRGELREGGLPMPAARAAELVGAPVDVVERAVAELERCGVYVRAADGVLAWADTELHREGIR